MIGVLDKFKFASARSLLNSLSALQREALLKSDQWILQQPGAQRVQELEADNERLLDEVTQVQSSLEKSRLDMECLRHENEKLAKELGAKNTATSVERAKAEHPIYGTLLHDFGFKKVYATDPALLIDKEKLPVWMKQRLFDPQRANAIASQKRKDNRFGFPGTVTVFDQKDKVRGVLDGQHRIGSLKLLLEAGAWKEGKEILTEVFTVSNEKEINDLFREINKSQPVQELDLPGAADDFIRDSINNVSLELQRRHGVMFSTSINCKMPHVNLDKLRQTLFESPVINAIIDSEESVDKASQKVLDFIDRVNTTLGKLSDADLTSLQERKPTAKALAKCRDNEFYLGIVANWTATKA